MNAEQLKTMDEVFERLMSMPEEEFKETLADIVARNDDTFQHMLEPKYPPKPSTGNE